MPGRHHGGPGPRGPRGHRPPPRRHYGPRRSCLGCCLQMLGLAAGVALTIALLVLLFI